jgi:hypothetical protein
MKTSTEKLESVCVHELGHAVVLARQGVKLKRVAVMKGAVKVGEIAGICDQTDLSWVFQLCEDYDAYDFRNLTVARNIRRTLRIAKCNLLREFKKEIENELVVCYAGIVAERLFGKARKRKTNSCGIDADATAIERLVRMCTAREDGLRDFPDGHISDGTCIRFLLALHPDRKIRRRIIERTIGELSSRSSQRLIKTLTPKLLAKGRLSRDELDLIWQTFNGKAAKASA